MPVRRTRASFARARGGDAEDEVRQMTMRESRIIRQEIRAGSPEPVTGVGNPGLHPEAAGADLGGDTGDVGTPRDMLGGTPAAAMGRQANPSRPRWSRRARGND